MYIIYIYSIYVGVCLICVYAKEKECECVVFYNVSIWHYSL